MGGWEGKSTAITAATVVVVIPAATTVAADATIIAAVASTVIATAATIIVAGAGATQTHILLTGPLVHVCLPCACLLFCLWYLTVKS